MAKDIIDSIKEGKCQIVVDEHKPHQSFHEIVFPTAWEFGHSFDTRKILGDQTIFHRCAYCGTRMFEVKTETRKITIGKNEQIFTKIQSGRRWGWYCKRCGYLEEKQKSYEF